MTKYPEDSLMARLECEFSTEEQGLFLQSFSAYLNHDPTDYVIDLDDVWEWMGFNKKSNAKASLLKYFTEENGDYKELAAATAASSSGSTSQHGGQNHQRIILSLDTFEDFCMRAGTAKAQVVRKYFRKMNRIAIAHIKDRELGRILELTKVGDLAIVDKEAAVSAAFLDKLGEYAVFYMGKMETLGPDDFVHKVGSSKCFKNRPKNIAREFGSAPVFLEVIPTLMYAELEKWVKGHDFFVKRKYKEAVNGKHKSVECFRGSMADFETFRDIIRKRSKILGSISHMTALELAQQKNEETRLRILEKETDMKEKCLEVRLHAVSQYLEAEANLESDPRDTHKHDACVRKLDALRILTCAQTSDSTTPGPTALTVLTPDSEEHKEGNMSHHEPTAKKIDMRFAQPVQIYCPDTLMFIKSFSAMAMALVDLSPDGQGSHSGIRTAIDCHYVYLNYRWARVPIGGDPDVAVTIPPTVYPSAATRPPLIAQLTLTGDMVVDVHSTLKLAGEAVNIKNNSGITKSITDPNGLATSRGFKWMYWNAVDPVLQAKYLATHTLPLDLTREGKAVNKLDAVTMKVLIPYPTIGAACKALSMGHDTLVKACENGTMCPNGYRWEFAEDIDKDVVAVLAEDSASTSSGMSITKIRKTGYVAQMADNGSVIDVMANQVLAAQAADVSAAAVNKALKTGTRTGVRQDKPNMLFKMWDDVAKAAQDEYLTHASLPERPVSGKCKRVYRTCVADGTVREFVSLATLRLETGVSEKKINAKINSQSEADGFRYSFTAP